MTEHIAGPITSKDGSSFHMVRTGRESVLLQLQHFAPATVLWAVQGGDICKRLGRPEPPILSDRQAMHELEKLFGELSDPEEPCS